MTARIRFTEKGVQVDQTSGINEVQFKLPATDTTGIRIDGGAGTVIWAPFSNGYWEDLPPSAVATWEEAVAAVQQMHAAETVIKIHMPVGFPLWWWCEPVVIPGGVWNLNNTLIVGPDPEGSGLDTDNWGYSGRPTTTLLQVVADSISSNPCRINGCRGLKNMSFKGQEEYSTYLVSSSYIPLNEDFAYIYTNDNSMFREGQRVMIGDHEGSTSFEGYFIVAAVDNVSGGIIIYNDGYDSEQDNFLNTGSGSWNVYPDTSIFYSESPQAWWDGDRKQFLLDNAEVRHYTSPPVTGSKWGVFHSDFGTNQELRLRNESYLHAATVFCDSDELSVVTEGACKIGWSAVRSYDDNGSVRFFPGAGSRISSQWVSYDTYYPYIVGVNPL
jgi:hypothetical protein